MIPNPSSPSTHRLLLRGLLVLGLLSLAACGSAGSSGSDPGSGRDRIRVMLDWTPNTNHAGIYLAAANGWYEDAGLDVEILQPGGGADVAQSVATGNVDVGVSAAEQVVPARQAGLPVVSVAAIIQHNTSSLISLAGDGIESPADLAGTTYGGFGGGFEEALVRALVSCDGGDPDSVTFANVGEADYRDGLTRDQYDSVWVFDAWDVIRMRDLDGLALNRIAFADHTDCIPDWYTPVLIAEERAVEEPSDALRRFLEVTRRGYQAAMADPAASADALLEAVPELDAKLVRASAAYLSTRYADDAARWGHQEATVWNDFVAFLVEHDLVEPGFDVDAAYDDTLLSTGG